MTDDDWHDDYWALRDDEHPLVPVADLSAEDDEAPARRRPRARWVAALFLAVALAGGAALLAFHGSSDGAGQRSGPGPRNSVKTIDDDRARLDVLGALHATTAAGSFQIHSTLTQTPARAAGTGGAGLTIVSDSTVNVDPIVTVATANVPGVGQVTSRVNGTDVWESGGADYGMTNGVLGPGAPLSQFASLTIGTLGPREGAVAMNSLASPTGYLDLAEQAVTDASSVGTGLVDGVVVREYRVDVDARKVLDRPGLTAEEIKTATAALALLEQQGYTTTTVTLSIDAAGLVRRTQTSVRFADGGSVDVEAVLSNFGCSTVSMLPTGPAIIANPAGCAG